jgi:hypothetical protein
MTLDVIHSARVPSSNVNKTRIASASNPKTQTCAAEMNAVRLNSLFICSWPTNVL